MSEGTASGLYRQGVTAVTDRARGERDDCRMAGAFPGMAPWGRSASTALTHAKRETQMPDSFHRTALPPQPKPCPSASHADVERSRAVLLETRGEWPVGRDPKTLTRAELAAAGHVPMSPLKALRARCRDCCAGSAHEVRLCTAVACPSWPFRMGRNPWRAEPSLEQRERARVLLAKLRACAADQGQEGGPDAKTDRT